MASKSAQHEPEKAEVIEEALDHLDTTLDRVKVLYEQFFLGIQKQPPSHLHTDVERKLRDLNQMQIRNTALRYRFATLQQKFGSYNNYWRRTLRQIENGTYARNLAKIGRQAALTGEDIPEEILAAMPKRMREQVKRDREAALAMKRRREQARQDDEFLDEAATGTSPVPRRTADGAHILDDADADFDLDAYFRAVTSEGDTNPEAQAFTGEVPTPTPAATTRISRTATFEGEPPTDADVARPGPVTSRPAPVTVSPVQHANPAVRAAVGMRVATPPAGVPRVTPTSIPIQRPSQPMPAVRPSGSMPAITDDNVDPSGAYGRTQPMPTQRPSQPMPTQPIPPVPRAPTPGTTSSIPRPLAPSQVSRPLPVMPGASSTRGPVPVETLSGPFPRHPTDPQGPAEPAARTPHPGARTAPGGFGPSRPGAPPPAPPRSPPPPPPGRTTQSIKRVDTQPGVGTPGRLRPPPGMTDADVNALYAKYVKAKEAVGEKAGPGAYGRLLQTINAQAPKIMEQYKAKGVDFQVVVKDNQVVIRAKPKP